MEAGDLVNAGSGLEGPYLYPQEIPSGSRLQIFPHTRRAALTVSLLSRCNHPHSWATALMDRGYSINPRLWHRPVPLSRNVGVWTVKEAAAERPYDNCDLSPSEDP